MKKILLLITGIILLSGFSFAQLKSVTVFADYSYTPTTRLEITNADAVGGGVKVKFTVWDNFNLSFIGGYKLYSLNEPDVLNNWGWQFWTDRYYNKIVSDLAADANLSVEIGAVQKMDVIPFVIFAEYDIEITDKFFVTPSVGSGIYFYTRRMYAVENWGKQFPAADYTFYYSFRNFAPAKKGNPAFVNSGIDLEYRLFEIMSIYTSINYNYIIPTEGSMGYDAFPFENEVSLKLGIAIKY
ncbi:MAG TPA: hypothetical protein VK870_06220 [Ignavibacteriaceae bacterium]|nr:hypothetical protein [Ignavibacteriaceae bacterium]